MEGAAQAAGVDSAPGRGGSLTPSADRSRIAPAVSLPKGGGAIRGMGEKFAANPVTGTAAMSIPIPTSPGRSDFGPALSLTYDSGAGNGPFGFGWSAGLPTIARKTEMGLPRYLDAEESDVFVLSGAEDLVPLVVPDARGAWARTTSTRTVGGQTFRVEGYRPRIEGLFARIERWTDSVDETNVFWRSISKENVTTWYGRTAESRVADPQEPTRIFSWLICETYDDKGNVIVYRYKAEDSERIFEGAHGGSEALAHERNRTAVARTAQRYLKRIRYGNRQAYLPVLDATNPWPEPVGANAPDGSSDWLFEVVVDYGEHDTEKPTPDETGLWPARPDRFSTYKAGFEVRTYRSCQRVLMFHHFPEEDGVGRACLVRSTGLRYSNADPGDATAPVYTFLTEVTQTGYRRQGSAYEQRSLPPVELRYSEPRLDDTVRQLDATSQAGLPVGLDSGDFRWADLHGEGVPGVLAEQLGTWFYKRNLSPAPDSAGVVSARFASTEIVAMKPSTGPVMRTDLLDLVGDGQPDLVVFDATVRGLFEHDAAEGWSPFRPFASPLNRDLHDPNVRLADLDGDGRVDVLITEDDTLVWHQSLGEEGFGPALAVGRAASEERGPRVVFADSTQSIYLADMSGDGLADIARVRNGDVCYWPNLGHGRFGAKVTMDNAPFVDNTDQFEQSRVRLADIDGSGTADLLYLHRDGVRIYYNQSGNGWSSRRDLAAFPRIDDVGTAVPIDLLGNGTACLVWSSPLPADAGRALRYIDLMGGRKPHLLVGVTNNLGAEVSVEYAPSTRFYVQDRLDGRPWVTRLPFPVHVVERVETIDHVGRNRFVTRYTYHDGCFDGEEREFRGFGMVEQWDTEELDTLISTVSEADNAAPESHVPPVHTKTWFHTGVEPFGRAGKRYWFSEPGRTDDEAQELLLPDPDVPSDLTPEEEREAWRALKGSMIRQEVYADDADVDATPEQVRRAQTPYTVTEHRFTVRTEQPRAGNRHAVFLTHEREVITYHYERDPTDPRVQHALTLEVDQWGNVLTSAAAAYGRRRQVRVVDAAGEVVLIANPALAALPAGDQLRQTTTLVTCTQNSVTNPVNSADSYRIPLVCDTVTWELTGMLATGPEGRLRPSDLLEPDPDDPVRLRLTATDEVPYEAEPSGNPCRRAVERARTLFRRDDLTGLLPLGALQSLALPGEAYRLAFTSGLLADTFSRPREDQPNDDLLPDPAEVLGGHAGDQGGYLASQDLRADGRFPATDPDGDWWVPSGHSFFHPDPQAGAADELTEARQHFFAPRRYRDPFGQDAIVDLDAYDLLLSETRDALANRVSVDAHDYRVLQPRLLSDPNRNQTEVAFDALGLVSGTAVMGKPAPATPEGDSLAGFAADLSQNQLDTLFSAADPRTVAVSLLGDASTRTAYDVDRFRRTRAAFPDDPARWEPACTATLTRETHAHAPMPPGGLRVRVNFFYSDGLGRQIQKKLQSEAGRLDPDPKAPVVSPRWVASGWTIYNNKGNPVRQYEPYFTDTHAFEFGTARGVSPILFYDPLDRVVATLHPDHTYEKVVFAPWLQTSYDANDTCAARNSQTGDPRTDPDIGGYVAEYLNRQEHWETWWAQRASGSRGTDEQNAATRAAGHADTPTTAHGDALGRPFLTVAHNRVVCAGHDLDGREDDVARRVNLDIEGNQRAVLDERALPVDHVPAGAVEQRVVIRYAYDMLGRRLVEESMDAGARWLLNDVAGQPLRTWDSRGHLLTYAYDALRRPVEVRVRGAFSDPDPLKPNSDPRTLDQELLVDRTEYGEPPAGATAAEESEAQRLNIRTRAIRCFDTAGVSTNARIDGNGDLVEAYDFKGNLLHGTRRLVSDITAIPDWSQHPQLDDETFEGSSRYDALNRVVQSVAPHSSLARATRQVLQPVFNDAQLLQGLDVWLHRDADPAGLIDATAEPPSPVGVTAIDYDAKGRRRSIEDKNGATTSYDYDPLTFRLTGLATTRNPLAFPDDDPHTPVTGWPGRLLQNLRYTYDPVGNITHTRDEAQQALFFANRRVEPGCDYTYDALYRLIQGTGREHLGQGQAPLAASHDDAGRVGLITADVAGRFAPGDGTAVGAYTERYVYDLVGNMLQYQHRGTDPANPGWTRTYEYTEPSLTEPALVSNRLSRTQVGSGATASVETYAYDARGDVLRLPHLGEGGAQPNLQWDFRGRLVQADLGGGGAAHYVYDGAGQRVRKVWQKAPGRTEERIYLGGTELFRLHAGELGTPPTLERETLSVTDGQQAVAVVEMRTLDTAGNDAAPARLIRYQLGDHLGSARLEVDDQSRIITYEEYAPYGATTYQAIRSQAEAPKRYRYTGKERDEETGLYYHGARYYATWLGRWMSCDPVPATNRYLYCADRPTALIDSNGSEESSFSNRLWGGVRLVGGAAQTIVGAAVFAQVEVPVAAQIVGGVAMVHGMSDIEAGWRQLVTGREERSAIENVVSATAEGLGATHSTAQKIGTGTDIALGFVSPVPATGGPRAGLALARGSRAAVLALDAPKSLDAVRAVELAQAARQPQIASHLFMAATAAMGGHGSSSSPSSSPSTSSQSGPASNSSGGQPNASKVPDEYFDEALSRIDRGDLQPSGAHLQDLTNHAQSSAARVERGVSGQSAHISARSAMRDLPGYDPRAALTRLLDGTAHRGFDDYWKRVFQDMARAGGKTISVGDYFNVMRDAIGHNPHFTTQEANSMVELLRDELFVQHGLKEGDVLRLPYSKP